MRLNLDDVSVIGIRVRKGLLAVHFDAGLSYLLLKLQMELGARM